MRNLTVIVLILAAGCRHDDLQSESSSKENSAEFSYNNLQLKSTAFPTESLETREMFLRKKNRLIQYHFKTPSAQGGTFPFLITIRGAGCGSAKGIHDYVAAGMHDKRIGIVSVEKRGYGTTDDNCSAEFLSNYTLEERINDHKEVINRLSSYPMWNGELYLFGISEGAMTAMKLAPDYPKLKGFVQLVGGGGIDFQESARRIASRRRYRCGTTYPTVQTFDAAMQQIDNQPNSSAIWCNPGNTHKWWSSIKRKNFLSDLLNVSAPIYMVHGDRDDVIDVSSAVSVRDNFALSNKTNLTFKRYAGRGHFLENPENPADISVSLYSAADESFVWLSGILQANAPQTVPLMNKWHAGQEDNILISTDLGKAQTSHYVTTGQEGCVFKNQVPGSVPLTLYFSAARGDNILVASETTRQVVLDSRLYRTRPPNEIQNEGYIWPANSNMPGSPLNLFWHAGRGDSYLAATPAGVEAAARANYTYVRVEGILPHCSN